MRAVFNRNVPASFVLGEERVRSLVKILQKHAGKPSFEATGADNTTWSFENLEELFEYENDLQDLQQSSPKRGTLRLLLTSALTL